MNLLESLSNAVTSIDSTVSVKNTGTNYAIVDDIKYCYVGAKVDILGSPFLIIDIDSNTVTFDKNFGDGITISQFTLPIPTVIFGTRATVANSLGSMTDYQFYMPLAHFLPNYGVNGNVNANELQSTNITLKLLTICDYERWNELKRFAYSVVPMNNLAVMVLNSFKISGKFFVIDESVSISYELKAAQTSQKSSQGVSYIDKMAGVNLTFEVKILNC
jgi:hypothetical protein